ncbi:MAG: HAD hydrolase-like protein [Pseudomonadota bacterium]
MNEKKNMAPAKCAVFDLDGVIADSRKMYVRAIALSMKAAGVPAQEEQVEKNIMPDVSAWVKSMKEEFGADVLMRIVMHARDFLTREGWKLVEPVTTVKPLLDYLRSGGFAIAMATNSPSAYALKVLERAGISDYFGLVVSCQEQGMKKDACLTSILERIGVEPGNAYYICDTAMDVTNANSAGVGAIVVFTDIAWDWPDRARVEKEGPATVAGSMEDVIAWLRRG